MISVILYMVLVAVLLYWIEPQALTFSKSLILKPHPADELEAWLKKFNWGKTTELQAQVSLPQYKFYSEILELILGFARRLGGSYQDSIGFLRHGLMADRQFEKKLKENLLGSWLQMTLMVVLTWLFVLSALWITDVQISSSRLVMIALWQLLGMVALPFSIRFYREKFFGDIGRLWKILYALQCLGKVPLARSEVMSMAGVPQLSLIKQKSLLHLVDKLHLICQQALKQGLGYQDEVAALMEELRFQEKWHFELFEKRMTLIKLGLMALFFLPSYLAFILLLLGDFLKMMV